MFTCISMLRGINVGGHKRVKMDELLSLYESLGFKNVETYLQSGNVVFSSPESDMSALAEKIEAGINRMLNISVAVLLRIPDELKRIIDGNPFLKEEGIDAGKLHVTFLSGVPSESSLARLRETKGGPDRFIAAGEEIYLYCPGGYGRTKFSNQFFVNIFR